MNIFFMGTPEFAVPTLDILNKKYNVIGVFTQPPRPSGRGMKEIKSSIQQYSEKNKLNFYTPNNLKNDETLNLLKIIKRVLTFIQKNLSPQSKKKLSFEMYETEQLEKCYNHFKR